MFVRNPSVESLDVLLAKGGDADKEVCGLINRLAAEPAEGSDTKLGLHYDLTVPMARYVAQNYGELVFPFKRYQIQRTWRVKRPQDGRFREFTQCVLSGPEHWRLKGR